MKFSYKPLNELGQSTTWMSLSGRFEDGQIVLADCFIDATTVLATHVNDKVLAITYKDPDSDPDAVRTILLSLDPRTANHLKRDIDVVRSAYHVGQAEAQAKARGESDWFRKAECPVCHATLDLTGFEPTPQIFCDYCDTLSTVPPQPETPSNESEYRLCEGCGMYARPRVFTEFYFYYIVILYGFWTNQSRKCPACMRGAAWKMLAINFLFVLGIIPSVWQLVRAYASDHTASSFRGLHSANLNARRRKYSAAIKTYQAICDQVPAAAGVHYNLGHALAQNQEWQRAAAAFELALADCSNYRYAAGGLMHCYQLLGMQSELDQMQRQWGEVADGASVEVLPDQG